MAEPTILGHLATFPDTENEFEMLTVVIFSDNQGWQVQYHMEENTPGIKYLMYSLGSSSHIPKFRVSVASRGFNISSAEDHANAMLEVEKAILMMRKAARDMLFNIQQVPEDEEGTRIYISRSFPFSLDNLQNFLLLQASSRVPIHFLSKSSAAIPPYTMDEWANFVKVLGNYDSSDSIIELLPKATMYKNGMRGLERSQTIVVSTILKQNSSGPTMTTFASLLIVG